MLISFCVLGCLASLNGGAGLTKLQGAIRFEGFDYSKYRIKSCIKDLIKIGAVVKVGDAYTLTLLGANLVAADIAAANGWEVIRDGDWGMSMPPYQKGL